jgi:GTP cyclohydrolase IA
MDNKKTFTLNLEVVKTGYANGVAPGFPFTEKEKWSMVDEAAEAYGKFLTALGCDWENDPNSSDTPRRVAKSYVFDLWKGRYDAMSDITSFPSDGYQGIVLEKDIPLVSQCSHHHQTIMGVVHIAYIPGPEGNVVGLSKLNRIVDHFGRRGAIQEQLTMAIHSAIDKICEGNVGVMVMVKATHNCVSCRGVKHQGASMMTSEVSGVFADHTKTAKMEVLEMIKMD